MTASAGDGIVLALTAPAASSRSLQGGRAARQYAYTFAPGRSAATLAWWGLTQLWGTTATQTQLKAE